jgi:hypothetical protein
VWFWIPLGRRGGGRGGQQKIRSLEGRSGKSDLLAEGGIKVRIEEIKVRVIERGRNRRWERGMDRGRDSSYHTFVVKKIDIDNETTSICFLYHIFSKIKGVFYHFRNFLNRLVCFVLKSMIFQNYIFVV